LPTDAHLGRLSPTGWEPYSADMSSGMPIHKES